jgi:photosynthetic reaction center cytochrome c subunit
MKFASRLALATALICLVVTQLASGQTGPEQTPLMAEDVFTNVPVLRGMPVDQFMDTMGMISAALNINCVDCHAEDGSTSWDKYAIETPRKRTARAMIQMVDELNRTNFGGVGRVTCFTCHRGDPIPKTTASLDIQYGERPEDPNDLFFPAQPIPGLPTVDQIFDKYIQALGGQQQLANLTSYVAKGIYTGYDSGSFPVAVEIFANSPNQNVTVVALPWGESVRTFDGDAAWIASADRPLPLISLTGANLDGARMDAMLAFPGQIRQISDQWRIAFSTAIDDREVQAIQGTGPGGTLVNLYFDEESGLLVRQVRIADTVIGRVPTQIDYEDYREVSGARMPFAWTVTWTTGQSRVELGQVRPNVPIDATRFATPEPAAPFIAQ